MTQPDPLAAPADNTPAEPVAAQETSTFDPTTLPPEAQAWIDSQVKTKVEGEKFKARDSARTAAAQKAADEARQAVYAELAQKAGLAGQDEPLTPEEFEAHLERSQHAAWESAAELQVYKAAASLGADAEKLLDSRTFMQSVLDIDGDDPYAAEFGEALKAKVADALARNPSLKAGGAGIPRPDQSQGARGSGPDVDSRIAEAQKRGDVATFIALQNKKLTRTT